MIAEKDADLRDQGLASEEARRRFRQLAPDEVDPGRNRTVITIVFETMKGPMFLPLVAAAAIYAFMGDLGEGLFLLGGAGAAIWLVILQDARSEQALRALQQLAQPQSRVLRDDAEWRVPAREIVSGYIVLAGEGERLPADGLLVAEDVLSVDGSVLTGKSAPVAKTPAQDATPVNEAARPGSGTGRNLPGPALLALAVAMRLTRSGWTALRFIVPGNRPELSEGAIR